jgi:hypothetical protein
MTLARFQIAACVAAKFFYAPPAAWSRL